MSDSAPRQRSYWPIAILSTLSSVINMLLPLVLVRLLTPEEIGTFKIFFLYMVLLPPFALIAGLQSGLAYWAGFRADQRGPVKNYPELQASGFLMLCLGASFFVLCVLFARQLGWLVNWDFLEAGGTNALIFAFALFGQISAPFFDEAVISTGRIWTGALYNSGFDIFRALSVLVCVYVFRTLESVLIAHASLIVLKTAIGYTAGFKMRLMSFRPSAAALTSVIGYAFPVSIAWLFGIFVNYADQFLLSHRVTPEAFAFYSIGCLSVPPLMILEHAITRVLIPQMSEAFATKRPDRALRLYQDSVESLGFVIIPAVAGLAVFSLPIIELLFTTRYSSASGYLIAFAFTYLYLIIPYDSVARAQGRAGWILKTFIIFATIAIVMDYFFIMWWGEFGALAGLLTSSGLMRLYAINYIRSDLAAPLSTFLPFRALLRFSLTAAVLSALSIAAHQWFTSSLTWFLVCGPIFAALYFVVAIPLRNRDHRARQTEKRVLLITQGLGLGGIERMVLQLCVGLKSQKEFVPFVFSYDQSPAATCDTKTLISEFERHGIPLMVFKKPERFSPLVVIRLIKYILQNDIHIIHTHDLGGLMYGVLAKILSFSRVTLVQTQHSFIHLDDARKYRTYEKIFNRFVDQLTVVSEEIKKVSVELGVSADRITVIENGVKFSEAPPPIHGAKNASRDALLKTLPPTAAPVRELLTAHIDATWLLYLARIFPRKGQDHAVALWSALAPQVRARSVLIFVGPESQEGERARIEALVRAAPDSGRIVFAGGSANPEQWCEASDVYLSCSEYEGMPLSPLEAIGSGVPALLSNIPGHDFLAALSAQYPLADAAAGAAQLERLITDLNAEADTSAMCRWTAGQSLRDRFSIAAMVRAYIETYRRSGRWHSEENHATKRPSDG